MSSILMDQSSVALRILGPRATVLGAGDSLENYITDPLPDGSVCWVTAAAALFRLHLDSAATADGINIVDPIHGPGQWLKESAGNPGLAFDGGASLGTITSGSSTVTITTSDSFPAEPGAFRVGTAVITITCTVTTPTVLRVTARQGSTGASVMIEIPIPNLAGNEIAVNVPILIDATEAGPVVLAISAALAGGNSLVIAGIGMVTYTAPLTSIGTFA